jgi:hypothetical protein
MKLESRELTTWESRHIKSRCLELATIPVQLLNRKEAWRTKLRLKRGPRLKRKI